MSIQRFFALILPPIFVKLVRRVFGKEKAVNKTVSIQEIARSFFDEVLKRSSLDPTDVEQLAEDIDHNGIWAISCSSDEPQHYGSYYSIVAYAYGSFYNIYPPKELFFQHGFAFKMTEWMMNKKEGINLVWSKYIKRITQEHTDNKHIYPIGAPFFYAKPLLSKEQIESERKRLGKNLLAFPLHSTAYYDINFDNDHFIALLKEQQKRFDSVRVCLYWKDVQKGMADIYHRAGFECVCCGHINDLLFLARQRALFEIADATISNGIGSYIGYSIYLDKPHWLVPEEYDIVDTGGTEAKELANIMKESDLSQEIFKAFGNNADYTITQVQKDLVDLLWGVSDVKTPEELRQLLQELHNMDGILS